MFLTVHTGTVCGSGGLLFITSDIKVAEDTNFLV